MALVIAGVSSGVGKTTVTLALLACMARRGYAVQSFKVGPDYIDPMFHQYVTNRPGRNLDPVLTSEAYVQECFARHIQGVDCALVEGVMGLFDGVRGDWASTAHIARLLDLPIVLAIDCSRLSGSVAAIAHGFQSFDPRINIAGVVLNKIGSDRHLELLKSALEPLHLPIVGIVRRQDNITIPDRHLGLVPTAEIPELNPITDRLAHLGETCFNWGTLLPLLKTNPTSSITLRSSEFPSASSASSAVPKKTQIRIAVARSNAFNFYYQDNLDIFSHLGAELVFWNPLTDTALPEKVQGMYFGGGFPEVFAAELSANSSAVTAVRAAILSGMPTYAECGGLMYLCQQIVDFNKHSWYMVGVLPATAVMGDRLTLGYRQAVALQDSPLVAAGATVWGHEFHRSYLSAMPTLPLYETRGYSELSSATLEGWRLHQLHASYVHLHFGAKTEIPARFLQHCASARR